MSSKLQILYLILVFFSQFSSVHIQNSFKTDLFKPNIQDFRSAYHGNPEEQISLADFYCKKKEYKCAKDEKAVFWYKETIKNESFEFQNKILEKYLEEGDKFLTKDIMYNLTDKYQKWAKAGDIKAQKLLTDLSSKRSVPENDYIKFLYKKQQNDSFKYKGCKGWSSNHKSNFEKALLNKCHSALFFYGFLLLNNLDDISYYKKYYELAVFPSDEKERKQKAIEVFRQLSRDKWDSIYRWSSIGDSFAYKFSNKKKEMEKYDFKLAVEFYKKAYDLGNDPKTAYEIGLLYKQGDKTLTKSNSKAFEWFYKSAIQNYMPAQVEVGYMYSHGLGVEKNQISAIKYLKKAHNHNLFACSVCYKTEIMLNNLGFINFFRNIKQIYQN